MGMKDAAQTYFKSLQKNIIQAFEALDPGCTFELQPWEKEPGAMLQGGGTMAIMRGKVFEKVGVNFSCVHGTFSEPFRAEIPGANESNGQFWASGVSLVSHMHNPHVPTVHMNVRRIETSKAWFGGGADLTPTIAYAEDTAHFHNTLKTACDSYSPQAYADYKAWCDDYFFIKHRNEPRGVGGIFFDYLEDRPAETFDFVKAVGQAFTTAYCPLVAKRKETPFTEEDKMKQYHKRAAYAEFNLLYDRGTRFGFQTGGNAEAILMSMPPQARWP